MKLRDCTTALGDLDEGTLAENLSVPYKGNSMKMDNLRRYIDLRDSLVREKATLEQRLEEINQALEQLRDGDVIGRAVVTYSGTALL